MAGLCVEGTAPTNSAGQASRSLRREAAIVILLNPLLATG